MAAMEGVVQSVPQTLLARQLQELQPVHCWMAALTCLAVLRSQGLLHKGSQLDDRRHADTAPGCEQHISAQ